MDDAEIIRDVARAVATMAQDMRDEGVRVADRATVRWSGSAAAQYHSELRERSADYRQLAGDLDRLHNALLSHARHVEDHKRVLGPLAQLSHLTDPLQRIVMGLAS